MMNESEVKRQLELLDLMNQAELREKFCDLFGFEPGQTNIANLRRRLACRIQEIYYGGLSEADRQLLEQIADGDPQANLMEVNRWRNRKSLLRTLIRERNGSEKSWFLQSNACQGNSSKLQSLTAGVCRTFTGMQS